MGSASADVDIVTRFVTGLATGDFETCSALVTADLVVSEAESLSFGGDWIGAQGLIDMLTTFLRDYRIKLGPPDVSSTGDHVIVRVSGSLGSRATGRQMPLQALDIYELRDGLITRIDVYYKDTAAVNALCLPADTKDDERPPATGSDQG